MHPELKNLTLPALVDRLEDIDGRKTPVGWSPDDAVLRSAIERRIMAVVTATPALPDDRRRVQRVPCDLRVQLANNDRSATGKARDIGHGGVFVETDDRFALGTSVRLEVLGGVDARGLRVRGEVAWSSADPHYCGVGVRFTDLDNDAQERRVRRLVVELLRHRVGRH